MSVKGKVKRLNREIDDLNDHISYLADKLASEEVQHEKEKEMLESLIKFFVVNQVGKPAAGGVHIEKQYVDKVNSLDIDIFYELENRAYVIELKEVKDEKTNNSI